MKIRELWEIIGRLPGDMEVILSKDSEGNSYSPLATFSPEFYVADGEYSGDIYGPDEEHPQPNAVVLWPMC